MALLAALLAGACLRSAPPLDAATSAWARLDTQHLTVRFSPQAEGAMTEAFGDASAPGERRDGFGRGRERALAAICEFVGGAPGGPIEIFVWGSDDEAGLVLGRSLGFAIVSQRRIHTRWNQTRGHEIAHVVIGEVLTPVHRTGLINEGAAVFLDQRRGDRFERARHGLDAPPDVLGLWRDWHAAGTYAVAGAWVAFLHEMGGRDRLLELLRDQTESRARQLYPELDAWLIAFDARLGYPTPTEGP